MAIDKELDVNDNYEQLSRVDGHAERLIMAKYIEDAKRKKIEENMDKYYTRHAYFQFILFVMVLGGIYFLYKIGCWEMIKDFFIKMSQ